MSGDPSEIFDVDDPRYDLGPYVDEHYVLLRHVLRSCRPTGVALEFGVGCGNSLNQIARFMPVIGFDSFQGLPEDWREGFPKGSFACERPNYDLPKHVQLIVGMFEETLPSFIPPLDIGMIHFDCDLYSSTATALAWIGQHIKQGCCIVFDEWHGYEGCQEHEQRAWREFADANKIEWEVIGHSFQQWGIRIV